MKPIDAYQDTSARARRFLKLYTGLINIRQRSIRSDWKSSFCKLMHWPQRSNIERVDSRDAVIILRPNASLGPDEFKKDALDDLLRMSLVYGVSALDRYVHERVIKGFVKAYKQGNLTREQREYSVPVTLAMNIVEKTRQAYRNGNTVRPSNEIRRFAQEELHRKPFQSWREIDYAFRLIGQSNLSGELQRAYVVGDMRPIKKQLNDIVARRHRIVHEGDLVRHQRGGNIKPQSIERMFVADSLDFLDDFVTKLDAIR